MTIPDGMPCERCFPDHRNTALGECVLCLDAVCTEHRATVIATGCAICRSCLALRNAIGPWVPTIRLTVA